ncbi:MAG: hypothetical protein JWQ35_1304 [Bacteriovoracaceae bacterium]|nr:hypothetical protein [Bacteriovoracaceae bacterium]
MAGKTRILFIGAGASLGARSTHSKRPPLGLQLCDWLREQIPLLQKEAYLVELHQIIYEGGKVLEKHSNENRFETLVSMLDRDDRVSLQRLLQICFSDLSEKRNTEIDLGCRSIPDGYDDLLDKLNIGSGDWTVISLNYDLLFEEAFRRKDIALQYQHFPFSLGQDQSKEPGVRIYKPHGSINFFAKPDHRIFHHEPAPEDDRGQPTHYDFDEEGNPNPVYPIVFAGLPGAANVLTKVDSSHVVFPVMANYTRGKKSDANLRTLELVRQDALTIAKNAEEIIVIGVKPIGEPADDNFAHELLSLPIPKYTYVTKDEADASVIRLIHRNVRICQNGLNEFLTS